ncbi:hypothetical protein F4818DRAFT_425687 [Hypoxylon cercidicola]|nr:hypothetical protein F4818DRAFT_425687 [Hypoxylon cercidicola]
MELLKEVSTYLNIKIYVSSQPWNIFHDAFQQNPMFQLEKLIRQNIKAFVYS